MRYLQARDAVECGIFGQRMLQDAVSSDEEYRVFR